jgi:hypothetical protein
MKIRDTRDDKTHFNMQGERSNSHFLPLSRGAFMQVPTLALTMHISFQIVLASKVPDCFSGSHGIHSV